MRARLAAGLFALATTLTHRASAQTPSPRASLIQADQAASQAVLRSGIVAGLGAVLDDSAVLLYAGAPPVSGKERVAQLLNAQPTLKNLRLQWFPIIVAVSQDGLFGVTSGASAIGTRQGVDSALQYGHYITVWRRAGGGPWRIIALVQNGLNDPDSTVIPETIRSAPGTVAISEPGRPFAQADVDFARLAADSGAPIAFGAWAAPDITTPPGTGIMAVGPAQIRARMAAGPAAGLPWEWHPVWSAAAGSGDLAATIGLSSIGPADQAFIGKYLTIWRRQPDGSIRFILDSGNERPK